MPRTGKPPGQKATEEWRAGGAKGEIRMMKPEGCVSVRQRQVCQAQFRFAMHDLCEHRRLR